jgi:hypothetical protein
MREPDYLGSYEVHFLVSRPVDVSKHITLTPVMFEEFYDFCCFPSNCCAVWNYRKAQSRNSDPLLYT